MVEYAAIIATFVLTVRRPSGAPTHPRSALDLNDTRAHLDPLFPSQKMSISLPYRPPDDTALSLAATTSPSKSNGLPRLSPSPSIIHRRTPSSSGNSARRRSLGNGAAAMYPKPRRCKSQYPRDSSERHVEYILVASFHIDRGPIMEHQYPAAISGDESMLAELMLPDQTHVRSQDWTIFFLHKDTSADADDDDDDASSTGKKKKKKKKSGVTDVESGDGDSEDAGGSTEEESSDEEEGGEGPPLMYVLNLVNTKQDNTVKRYVLLPSSQATQLILNTYSGAVVKAMAICTRHSFLHIYKVGSFTQYIPMVELTGNNSLCFS